MVEWLGGLNRYQQLVVVSVVVLIASVCAMVWVDLPLARAMRSLDAGTRALAEPITTLGKAEWSMTAAGLVTVYWCWRRRWALANASAYVFFAIACTLVVHLFKLLVGRARPKLYFDDGFYGFEPFKLGYDYSAYPSGHSAVAGALGVSVWMVCPNWLRWPVLVLTVLIALSRVLITAHWLGDVMAGYLLGVVCAVFLHWRFTRRRWLVEPAGLLRARGVGG